MSDYEWTDRKQAMLSALDTLNRLILQLGPRTDAYDEATTVRTKLTKNSLTEEELIDYLMQSVIDYNANKSY